MSMVNPAAVPMPGAMSNRSDLPPAQGAKRLPDAAYGEQKQKPLAIIIKGNPSRKQPNTPCAK